MNQFFLISILLVFVLSCKNNESSSNSIVKDSQPTIGTSGNVIKTRVSSDINDLLPKIEESQITNYDSIKIIDAIDEVCLIIGAKRISSITNSTIYGSGNEGFFHCKTNISNYISNSMIYNFKIDKNYRIFSFTPDSLINPGFSMRKNRVEDASQISILDSIVKSFTNKYKIDLYGSAWVNKSIEKYHFVTYCSKPLDDRAIRLDPFITFLIYENRHIVEFYYGA